MIIYYTGVDCGDGSISVRFFSDERCIPLLEEYDMEGYRGEGGGRFEIPVEVALLSGLTISSYDDVLAEIKEYQEWNDSFSPTAHLGLLPQT